MKKETDKTMEELLEEIQELKQKLAKSENLNKKLKYEEKYESIVNNMIDGYYRSDKDGNAIFISPSVEKILGFNRDEIIGRKISSFYANENDREKFLAEIKKKGSVKNYPAEFKKKGENNIFIETNCSVYFDEDGNYAGVEGSFRDISEHRHKEKLIKEKESLLRQIIDLVPHIIFAKDIDSKFLLANKALADTYGTTTENITGKSDLDFALNKDDAKNFIKDDKEVMKSGKLKFVPEEQITDSQGNIRYLQTTKIPFLSSLTEEAAILGIAMDITEAKRAEQIQKVLFNISNAVITTDNLIELIERIKEELGTIIDTTNFFVAMYEPQTNTFSLPFISDEREDLDDFPAGKTVCNYIIRTQQSLLANKEDFMKLVKTGVIEIVGPASEMWLGVPLKVEGKTTGVLAVQSYTDNLAYNESDLHMLEFVSEQISISIDRKISEDKLKVALNNALESDRLKSAFLSNMSHEIRTPMNGILGFVSLLNNPDLDHSDRKKFTDIINSSSDRLLSTINNLIDISKIEAGQMKLSKTETSLNKLFNELFDFFNHEAKAKGLSLISLPTLSNYQATVYTDNDKLHGILTNLIKNAIKFTNKGSISFGYTLKGDFIEFFVEDTGIGVPENRRQAIFNRFEQADIEDINVFEGSGLGLAISKAYVEMLGGKLWLISKENKLTEAKAGGSKFVFTVPNNNQTREFTASPIISEDIKKEEISRDLKILIADDEEVSLQFLKAILQDNIHDISYAKTGKEVIEICKKNSDIDIILMDIKMPVLDGYEATQEIRRFNKDVIIIAQTAYALADDRQKAIEAGCNDYISKPINKDELIGIIKKSLRRPVKTV